MSEPIAINRQPQEWQQSDIRCWYQACAGICPTCKMNLNAMQPLYNLYPHWAGQCLAAGCCDTDAPEGR